MRYRPGVNLPSPASFTATCQSGLAALLRQRFPDLTPARIIHQDAATARHPGGGSATWSAPAYRCGGRADVGHSRPACFGAIQRQTTSHPRWWSRIPDQIARLRLWRRWPSALRWPGLGALARRSAEPPMRNRFRAAVQHQARLASALARHASSHSWRRAQVGGDCAGSLGVIVATVAHRGRRITGWVAAVYAWLHGGAGGPRIPRQNLWSGPP